jgi:GNAT superfamily N-acetyltransferase
VEIREATAEDWPRIYPFWSAIVEAGETYAYPEGLSSAEAEPLWMEKPPGLTVVAVGDGRDGAVLGSAKMGPNRPGRGAHIATASFMVSPAAAGQGVARELGNYMVDWARREGYHGIQFNAVVETNAVAMHLWQAFGFEVLATVPQAFEHRTFGRVGLNILYKKL